jgi:hypothetical protein
MGYGRFAATMARFSSAAVPVAGAPQQPDGRPAPSDIGPLATLITELEAP